MGKHGEFDPREQRPVSFNAAQKPRSERSATTALSAAVANQSEETAATRRGSTSISVLVGDQHQLLVRGIASVLSAEADMHLQAQAINADQALRKIRELRPDVALLSLKLPGKGALGVLDALQGKACITRTVILADHMEEEDFLRATRLGARGVVLMSMPPDLLVRCIRMVHAGEEFVEKNILLRTFGKLMRELKAQEQVSEALTTREHAVMELAITGISNKDVARKLAITEGTVKAHLHSAYAKLGVNGRMGLFHYAKEHGLF